MIPLLGPLSPRPGQCCKTGVRTRPILEVAHADEGPHAIANGLLLRSDLHTLFDRGYVTVTPDLRVEVSHRIREEFQDGHEYYRRHGPAAGSATSDARPSAPVALGSPAANMNIRVSNPDVMKTTFLPNRNPEAMPAGWVRPH